MEGLKRDAAGPGRLLAMLGSLADPTRLRLLALVERHELGVAELCDAVKLPQSTVSRHLKVLAEEGWLASRRDGTAHLYRMAPELSAAQRRLWRVARADLAGWATLGQDALRLERRLSSRREDADRFFAGAAGEWERLRRELYGAAFADAALLSLVPRDLVVADLGCGTGDLAARLAPHVRRVIAVDRSAAMLRAARRRVEALENVELRRADLEALPVADESCGAALLVLALTYVAEPAAVVAEAARVLAPGGVLALADLARHDDAEFKRRMGQASLGFAPEDLAALLAGAGLTVTRAEALPPEPGARGPALIAARAEKPRARSARAAATA
jgi:SAM-dependent methyltransferase